MAMIHKEFDEMFNEVKNFQKQHETFIRQFLLEMGMRALRKTKPRTPVDTGTLRNAWQLSNVYRKNSQELYIVLFNPIMYASFVELGHMNRTRTKWVDGFYMATVSIKEIEQEIPQRYERALKQFLNGINKYIK